MNYKNIVVGIEGLVGSGKTTLCRTLLSVVPNAVFLNGGNMYRSIVYIMMKKGINLEELKANAKNINIKKMMDKMNIKMKIEDGETFFYCDGEKITEEVIQAADVSLAVSNVGGIANNEKLFKFARKVIRHLKRKHFVIISGRGIMKIYPKTDYHFLITADLDERVRRKCKQYNSEEFEKIKANIEERDRLQEQAGFYDKSENTIVLDITKCSSPLEEVQKVMSYIDK